MTGGAEEGIQTTIPISIPTPTSSGEVEKKGIMEKIKEKIPGMHWMNVIFQVCMCVDFWQLKPIRIFIMVQENRIVNK